MQKNLDATERKKKVWETFLAKGRACRVGGNYYYGARYGVYPERSRRDPKFSIWLSVDPLFELYPSYSSYAYVMQNPIRFTDPTGMAAENGNSGCGFGCKLRKFANSIIHPGENLNINTDRLSSRYSAGTGWELNKEKPKNNSTPKREPQQVVNALEVERIIMSEINIQAIEKIQRLISPNSQRGIEIGGRLFSPSGSTNITFYFESIGGISSFNSGKNNLDSSNRINPLSQNTELDLRAVARYLNARPQARIRFQYPTIQGSLHPNVHNDNSIVFGMSFSQITNYLRGQGVQNLNNRVLRSSGSSFSVFLDD